MARGTEKGMVIYRDLVEIEGLSKPFEKECRLYKDDGVFSITYPKREIYGKDIIETDMVRSARLKDAEKMWDEQVEIFSKLSRKYTLEIRYSMSEQAAVYGTNVSFNLQWGVFRKIQRKLDDGGAWFMLERSFDDAYRYKSHGEVHKWNSIPHTPEAEQFFRNLSANIVAMHAKLNDFLSHPFDISQAQKLLTVK